MNLNPKRTIAALRELQALTGDEKGAQRVAFSPPWIKARNWFLNQLRDLPCLVQMDEAANLWITFKGQSQKELWIGGHLDSVPGGGWLDGAFDLLAGLEVLRSYCSASSPPLTLCLVDWADEEGTRFGRSLFGSSAVSGSLQEEEIFSLRDRSGILLSDVLKDYGLDPKKVLDASKRKINAAAYLEVHIEQGAVLENLSLPLGAVIGTAGVERHRLVFTGMANHSGSTPMALRKDALVGASRLVLFLRDVAKSYNGVATAGCCEVEPGLPTAIPGICRLTVDLRHLDKTNLQKMWRETLRKAQLIARDEGLELGCETLLQVDPVSFHPQLVELCKESILEVFPAVHTMGSGPLHDGTEIAKAGIPSAMMFVQSKGGISHSPKEDSSIEHLELAVIALEKWVKKTIDWILGNNR
ncbi:Zn-dependent hydrolase [Candidatus Methylacidiphilum infernorum]|uniref:Zn-dependent hydrolase n=1 Tax=Candidatus Methylacidiphilum infernorum TaxID=511746 RepID=A0ABX7PU78_9BACT|nr:Zn-dependent hydrolase [Candidatus Methylacidiphilum infernorum]QSR86457.1 Zn-dependent hydrolase [Candidatus Methylacidiphilum infernorum]